MPLELGQITYIYPFDNPSFAVIAPICMVVALALFIHAVVIQKGDYLPHLKRGAIAACFGLMFCWSSIAITGNIYTAVAVPATSWDGTTLTLTTQELVPMVTGTLLTQEPILLITSLLISVIYFIGTLTLLVRWKNTAARVRARRHTNAG